VRFAFKTAYEHDLGLFRDPVQRRWYAALLAGVVLLPLAIPAYLSDMSMVFIYGLCGLSLMVLAGYTGLVSLGHAAFLGIGAYAHVYFTQDLGLPWIVSVALAAVAAAASGVLVGLPALRMTGVYLTIATLAFTEPFLFDRNMTGSINLYRADVRYINQFTQRSSGGVIGLGYPLGGFTRLFTNYSYERVRVTEINTAYTDPQVLARNPFLRDSLLIGANGERIISKITPSLVHNTVDQPIFPNQGVRYTAAIDLAGLGGNTSFYKPSLEGIWYWRQKGRLSLGLRALTEYIHSYANSRDLPIFQKIFLGGEYSVRGFDIRSIGPQDANTGLILGGNKSLLFNVEQNINIMSQLRVILFYDAGQVRDVGQSFAFKETLKQRIVPDLPLLYDPNVDPRVLGPKDALFSESSVSAFKTSTGVEVRLFMPVINVPFRLIFAYNPQRAGVLANTLQPQKAFQFRFAVGTTF